MGKSKWKGRNQRKDFKAKREDWWDPKITRRGKNEADGWSKHTVENEMFEEYYKEQGIVPEGQWDLFMTTLRTDLPITFRINGKGKFAETLQKRLEEDIFSKVKELRKDTCKPPHKLEWYPGGLAYRLDMSRNDLRKDPVLSQIHEFMKRENDVGSISRQEAVSMLPPLLLDVQPHHKVLDMCAAPGSKTFQLLEMLHAGEPTAPPTGFVIANDADFQRCNLLVHQIKRVCSPALVITTHDAAHYPYPKPRRREQQPLLDFDRVLCDVPCSGDGTLRKAPDIWSRWTPYDGNGNHNLQLRIALRACKVLKVGGRMVYSTCSLNPVENEAVVADVLRRVGGCMELLDVSDSLPGLKTRPGLKTWKVRDKDRWYSDWKAVEAFENEMGKGPSTIVDPTMFPDALSDAMPLERCLRLLPFDGDTGGFFVAVLKKVAPLGVVDYPTIEHRKSKKDKRNAPVSQHKAESRSAKPNDTMRADRGPPSSKDTTAAGVPSSVEVRDGEVSCTEAEPGQPSSTTRAEEPKGEPADGTCGDVKPPALVDKEEREAAGSQYGSVDQAADGGGEIGGKKGGNVVMEEAGAQPIAVAEKEGAQWVRSPNHKQGKWPGVDGIFTMDDHWMVKQVQQFYGIDAVDLSAHLITRANSNDAPRKIYFVSKAVRDLLDVDAENFLRMPVLGLKMFDRHYQTSTGIPCVYRLSQEGLPVILPHITKQVVHLHVRDMLRVLEERSVPLPRDLPDPGFPEGKEAELNFGTPKSPILDDQATLEQLKVTQHGGCVLMLRDEQAVALGLPLSSEAKGGLTANCPVAVACWRDRLSLNVMVKKPECLVFAERLREGMARAGMPEASRPTGGSSAEKSGCGLEPGTDGKGVTCMDEDGAEDVGAKKREHEGLEGTGDRVGRAEREKKLKSDHE
ncbi:unnamed protein product [Ostreobium quekettii]|uniref:SAM-dependent MTase RsmB/NOP-type domain-containing protein n=1 Tax=Ostreobium quekettii TaxID=121088 RepID=A0A8S1IVV4_9CHLO|nr:unnamed protein product [Ostreobium quekettii]|eukprot:evm.model.scf_1122.1 EVM.evm.TU.scf_1122.1   scf_1122:4599-14021(+)